MSKKLTIACRRCGQSVETYPSRPAKYCSLNCYWEQKAGIKRIQNLVAKYEEFLDLIYLPKLVEAISNEV